VTLPAGTSRSTPTRALTGPKLLWMPRSCSRTSGAVGRPPCGPPTSSVVSGAEVLIPVSAGYEIPYCEQTLWPTAEQSADAWMNLSLMTVDFMFWAFTETGVSSTDLTAVLALESCVEPFASPDGGVCLARR